MSTNQASIALVREHSDDRIFPSRATIFHPESHGRTPGLTGEELLVVGVVTPEIAALMLERNTKNRGKKRRKIADYGRMMQEGRWPFTAEAIKFGIDGRLLDGQNRLFACVETGVPFLTLVAYGIDPKVFPHLDRGTRRTAGDNLTAEGEKSAFVLAAAAALLWRDGLNLPIYGIDQPEPDEVDLVLQRHPGLRDSMEKAKGTTRLFRSAAAATFFHYRFALSNPAAADYFFEKLAKKAELLANTDPIKVLYERLNFEAAAKRKSGKKPHYAAIIKAWNYHIQGRPAKGGNALRLRERGDAQERFPDIL